MAGREKKLQKIGWVGFILIFILFGNLIREVSTYVKQITSMTIAEHISRILVLIIYILIAYAVIQYMLRRKHLYHDEVKHSSKLSIRDTIIFALTWSADIYRDIPREHRRLIRNAYVMICLALGIILLFSGVNYFLLVALLILGAVNVLVWVVDHERKRKDQLESEMETARKMQLTLMPAHPPELSGFQIFGFCLPAVNVGGDHFDYLLTGGDRPHLLVTVMDVAGKGMDAALTAVYVSGALRSLIQHQGDISQKVSELNQLVMIKKTRSQFVSLLLLDIDPQGKQLHYVNAGQSRPLLLRQGNIQDLNSPGQRFPLGVRDNAVYSMSTLTLQPEDYLLLFTDGVTDAENEHGDVFGTERLFPLLRDLTAHQQSAREVLGGIQNQLLAFTGSHPLFDDVTCVLLKIS